MLQRQDTLEEYVLTNGILVGWGYPEEKRVEAVYNGCEDIKNITGQDTLLKFTGRFLKVRVNLSMVCAGREIALGVVLQEKIDDDLITRGFKVCEVHVPENPGTLFADMAVKEFCFIIPEGSMCVTRCFQICVVAHYSSVMKEIKTGS